MLTYTGSRNLFGTFTNNSNSTNLTLGDTLINESIRDIISHRNWDFREATKTQVTVASQQFYYLPYDYGTLKNVTVTVGTYTYTPQEITDRVLWDRINETTSFTSTMPQYFYIYGGRIGFFPIPSAASNTITVTYVKIVKDLSIADYTTGGVLSITNGATAMVGTGTTWTTSMAGRFIRITESDAASKGDGYWYEIASVGSATTITLLKPYNGTTLAAANAAYTLGQTSIIPESYQILPVYRSVNLYFTSVNPDQTRALYYERLYKDGIQRMIADVGSKSDSPVLTDTPVRLTNPNLMITFS